METFQHIILISSIPLHIPRPSIRLGRPTVRINSYFIQLTRNSSAQQFSVESETSTVNTSKAPAKKNTHERWDPDDKKVLVQPWGENLEKLESKDSHEAWEEVTRLLNERQKTKKFVDQCHKR